MADPGKPTDWETLLDDELRRMQLRGTPARNAAAESKPSASGADPERWATRLTEPWHTGRSVSVGQLRDQVSYTTGNGLALREDLCDESGALLLRAGTALTSSFLQTLRERGVTRVRLRSPGSGRRTAPTEPGGTHKTDSESSALQTERSRELDERLAGELKGDVRYHPVMAWRRPRLPIDALKAQAVVGLEQHRETSAAVAEVCAALHAGRRTSASQLRRTVTNFVGMAHHDFDLLPMIVAMQQSGDEYLYDHCVNVSMLSMALASHLQLDREAIAAVGMAGLLHDAGMLRVPESIRLAERELTEKEWSEIHRHPLHTLDMLSELRGIPPAVTFVAYQAHERCDGSGYPRRCTGGQVHEYAKIVALADAYAAMTRERPYRAAIAPYVAVKKILTDGAKDRFDRVLVRAFLDTVSLFPIGSQVALSNGSSAKVLRANPGQHTKPVIEELSAEGAPTGRFIDLSKEEDLRVVRAT